MSGGRPAQQLGSAGKIWVEKKASGTYVAKAWRRDLDGRRRQVSATGSTKGAATRAVQRKLDEPVRLGGLGVTHTWTVEQLAAHWLRRKATVGKAGSGRPVKGQTLKTYSASIDRLMVPRLGGLRVHEVTAAIVENVLVFLESNDISTDGARTVLTQMMKLALRDGAITHSPMAGVAPSARAASPVRALSMTEVWDHLDLLHPDNRALAPRREEETTTSPSRS